MSWCVVQLPITAPPYLPICTAFADNLRTELSPRRRTPAINQSALGAAGRADMRLATSKQAPAPGNLKHGYHEPTTGKLVHSPERRKTGKLEHGLRKPTAGKLEDGRHERTDGKPERQLKPPTSSARRLTASAFLRPPQVRVRSTAVT